MREFKSLLWATVVLSCVAMGGAALGQGLECLTPSPEGPLIEPLSADYPYTHSISHAIVYLRVHDLQLPDGTGDLTDAYIYDFVDRMTAAYGGAIDFRIKSIENAPFENYNNNQSFIYPNEEWGALYPFNSTDAIDVVLTDPSHGRAMGVASAIVGTKFLVSGIDMDYEIGAHEVGHCLGLYHTHEDWTFGVELPDGSNCSIAGDLVCDTSAAVILHHEGLVNLDSCSLTPLFYANYPGYDPDPTNIMAYSLMPCMTEFSEQQIDRVLATIESSPILAGAVEFSSVVYADRSERPDGTKLMPYQGLPYSSVTVDFDGAGPRDMVVSLLNDRAQLYAATQLTDDGGIPAYYPVNDAFATGSEASLVLGLSVADVNGDGHEELFGASQTAPRLYQLQGAAYVDMASSWGIATSALLSTTGAWADFDCDGDVDLAIGTSDCGAFEPGVYNAGPPVVDVLLRNDLIATGAFADVSVVSGIQTGIDPEYYSNSTTVTWGDINDDGYPDLFIGEFGEPVTGPPPGIDCRLFVNQRNGTFIDEADSLIGNQQAVFTIAGIWRDMDNDGDLDLELAKKTKRLSLRYDTGTGLVSMDDSEDDGQYSGLRIYDHDLDGFEDVLLLPSVASDVPRLLAGTADGGDVSYTNVTAATGIAIPGKIGGAVAADLNGDGDIDLFLGREPEKDAGGAYLEGDQYLFQAKSQNGTVDAPANNWLSIRLQSASGMNNRMGIGAKVRVYDAGRQRVRLVDGGSGRGGQDDPTMVFGLGAGTTVDSVTVDWPNGYHQVVAGGSLNIWTGSGGNGANVIADASTLSVVAKAVTGTYEFAGGSTVDWVFSWETPLKTNPALDRVIFDNLNMAPECAQQVDEIGPDGSDVVQTVEMLANGRQHHVLKWLNRPCMPGCVIKFSVRSGINSNEIESAVKSFSMRFCPTN